MAKTKAPSFYFLRLLLVGSLIHPWTLHAATPMTLDQVLTLALERSESIRSLEQSLQASEADIRSRDLVLSPTLSSTLSFEKDQLDSLSSSNRDNSTRLLDLTLTQAFATGTKLSLNLSQNSVTDESFTGDRHVANWELRLSQSLWRDAFGRSTRLRHEAESWEIKSRRTETLASRQQFLIDVESAYWNLVLAHKEEAIRQENIKRSITLEKWVRSRMGRFAADTTDLLQVQALRSQRQLDLISAQNNLEAARNRLRQWIPDIQPTSWTLDLPALEVDRDPRSLFVSDKRSGRAEAPSTTPPMRLAALSNAYGAQRARLEATRAEDTLRPDLSIFASYGSNGVKDTVGSSWDRTLAQEAPGKAVGLTLSMELDEGLKNQRRTAALLNAQAQESRSQALSRESEVIWNELQRNIASLKIQIGEARALAAVQLKKAQAERVRYEQGRTTALQLTTFEVDAADSEIRLYRLLTLLRTTESAARLFAAEEGR